MRIKSWLLLSTLFMTAALLAAVSVPAPVSPSVSSPQSAAAFKVEHVGSVNLEEGVSKILFYDDYAYVLTESGIGIIDISDPEYPLTVGAVALNSSGVIKIFRINDGYLYAVDADETGLYIFSLSNPVAPVQTGFCALTGHFLISDICVIRDYVYVIKNFGTEISIIDVADAAAPTVAKNLDDYSYMYNVQLYGDTMYYPLSAHPSIGAVDVSDPLNPVSLGTFGYGYRNTAKIFVSGDYLYLDYSTYLGGYSSNSLQIYDVSQFSQVEQLATLAISTDKTGGSDLYKAGPYLYGAYVEDGIHVFDVSQPDAPALTGTIVTGAKARVVKVYRDLLFVGTATGLEIWQHQQLSGHTRPFGTFETPVHNARVSGGVAVTGWALDDQGIQKVQIFRDPVSGEASGMVYIGDAVMVKGARPDVEAAYPQCPGNDRAGWGYMLLTNQLPNGNGVFKLHAYAVDIDGHTEKLGSKTITVNNADSVKPFGAIDTPAQGGTASGNNYINFGWALTPQPNTIPTDGSTITVWVDGQPLGHPVYNRYRADIAALFPGYNNTDGAVGYYYLDTTAYANGVHNIAWSVRDDAGNTDGIGSRYFTIRNTDTPEDAAPKERRTMQVFKANGHTVPAVASGILQAEPSRATVTVKKGYALSTGATQYKPDRDGTVTVNLKQGERVEINLTDLYGNNSMGNYKGFMVMGKKRRSLPVGSTLDVENGIFYWQPGPGFRGTFPLVFYMDTASDAPERQRTKIVKITCKIK